MTVFLHICLQCIFISWWAVPANIWYHFFLSLWDGHKALNLQKSRSEQKITHSNSFPVGVKIFQRWEYLNVAIDGEILFSLSFEAHVSKLRSLETSPATLGSQPKEKHEGNLQPSWACKMHKVPDSHCSNWHCKLAGPFAYMHTFYFNKFFQRWSPDLLLRKWKEF